MNRDLFLAILSMDSYNRRYDQGIGGLPNSGSIGNATFLTDAASVLGLQQAQSAGFYAIAYNWNGETVIAYRGTDNQFDLDLINGYGTGLGLPYEPQAIMAINFGITVTVHLIALNCRSLPVCTFAAIRRGLMLLRSSP